jgi:hypothetical protein
LEFPLFYFNFFGLLCGKADRILFDLLTGIPALDRVLITRSSRTSVFFTGANFFCGDFCSAVLLPSEYDFFNTPLSFSLGRF